MELPHIYTTKVNKQHVQLTEIITKMIIHIGCYIGELTSNTNNTLFYMVVSRKRKIRLLEIQNVNKLQEKGLGRINYVLN